MKELNLTLYEIFGYLLPGGIASLAVGMVFYLTTMSDAMIYIPEMSKTLAVILIAIAYFSGHVVQAIGNIIFKKIHYSAHALPPSLIENTKSTLAQLHGIDTSNMDPHLLYSLCDAFLVQNGNVGDRDIFQYREGFYRGVSVSCIFLFVASILMLWHGIFRVRWFTYCDLTITPWMFLFFSIVSIMGAVLFYWRYKRFANYKIVQVVTGVLAVKKT